MSQQEYKGPFFRITHTIEGEGPHLTNPHDYYDDTYTVTVVLYGEGACYIEGNGYKLSDGDLVVISPDEIRHFKFAQSGYHERVSLYFSKTLLSSMWELELLLIQIFRKDPPGIGNKYTAQDYNRETVMYIIDNLCSIIQNADLSMKDSRIHLLILELLFTLYDSQKPAVMPLSNQAQDSKIWEICRYIKEHLSDNLSYSQLQARFFVSRYQLTEVFKRTTGMTLTEYITHKRLLQVTTLVCNGDGIESAAYRSGFHTYSHFYKEFKKRYKLSPKEYYSNNNK